MKIHALPGVKIGGGDGEGAVGVYPASDDIEQAALDASEAVAAETHRHFLGARLMGIFFFDFTTFFGSGVFGSMNEIDGSEIMP